MKRGKKRRKIPMLKFWSFVGAVAAVIVGGLLMKPAEKLVDGVKKVVKK